MAEAYQESVENVFKSLGTTKKGLTPGEVKSRLEKYGFNELKVEKKISPLKIFIEQFKSFLILILIVATVVSAFIGEWIDASVILLIVILNAIFGFFQEYKAERAMEELKKLTPLTAVVIRDGKARRIDAKELVPGDVLVLEAGDRIPADARLFESMELRVDEASLTGESTPVEKNTAQLRKDVQVTDRKNMVFMGTTAVFGRGNAIIISTGMRTEFGKIAKLIQEAEEKMTPLQEKLDKFGKFLGVFIIAICAVVAVLGILKGLGAIDMFITGVSLAVAAIPEGLPAVVTITLALGLQKMAKKNAIVRRLPAVETLGSTTVICSDKTGTLTKNEMVVRQIYADGKSIKVTGEGYKPLGEFYVGNKMLDLKRSSGLGQLLKICVLCNDAKLEDSGVIGDPTEGALLVVAEKGGLKLDETYEKFRTVYELPFESDRKRMTTINKVGTKNVAHMKGAVESVLRICDRIYENGKVKKLSEKEKKEILKKNEDMARDALRVLAFSYKEVDSKSHYTINETERNMIFVGLAGMIDPPRPEVKDAIRKCKEAGISVKMITGDHRLTAIAVAREIGLAGKDDEALTGDEIEKMKDEELEKVVEKVDVFARVSPEHKLRIIKALNNRGHVTAVTGDGVNDAPALKEADIGVAMGITGTDVSKEASDMVLTDDNFASIVSAVESGRGIYQNIIEFVMYLLSCNTGEVLAVLAATLLLPFLPLTAIQILWVNLVTDGLPALALGIDPPEKDVMMVKPRRRNEPVITKRRLFMIIFIGVLIAIEVLLAFLSVGFDDRLRATTVAFTTLVMLEMVIAFSSKSERPIFERGIFDNKFLVGAVASSIVLQLAVVYIPQLNPIFDTVPLALGDWLGIISLSLLMFSLIELVKLILSRLEKEPTFITYKRIYKEERSI